MIDVDSEVGPGLALDLRWTLRGSTRQITDVTEAGADDIIVVEEPRDRVRFGAGLDDYERFLAT